MKFIDLLRSWAAPLIAPPRITAHHDNAPPVQTASNPMQMPTPIMLILRGIKGHFAARDWPRGALDEQPAREYALRRGYIGKVLDVSGEAYEGSPQATQALAVFRYDPAVMAFYGFSGGGFNIANHILPALNPAERRRVKLVVVLGAPGSKTNSTGSWELVWRDDPPGGHMDGPRALLAELTTKEAVT